MPAETHDLTRLLNEMQAGDSDAASRAMDMVYRELHRLASHYMHGERPSHTLQTTALVHEAYLRLVGAQEVEWQNRAHFFALAAKQMRCVLVDHARAAQSLKRGQNPIRVPIEEAQGLGVPGDPDVLALDEALQELEKLDPRASQVVELRFFGGCTDKEAAEILGVSLATVRRDWEVAKAWL